MDVPSPIRKQALRYQVPEYLLLLGGPSNYSDRVLKALSNQAMHFMGQDIRVIQDEIKSMAKYVLQTRNEYTIAFQGSGNGGNEAILRNLTDSGDKVIVAIGGTWGELVLDMAIRSKLDVLALRKLPGEIYDLKELENAIVDHKAKVLFITQGESSGGTLQCLEGLGKICHKYDCLLVVDAVVSVGVEPLFVDRWEIDGVTAASQKAIGAPPGLCLISLTPRAVERMNIKKEQPPYCQDLKLAGAYWNSVGTTSGYHLTYSSNNLVALREALAQICEEGLDNMWARHKANAVYLTKRMEDLGLNHFINKTERRFSGVVCVVLPEDVDGKVLLDYIKQTYKIEISLGYGPTLNKGLRIGLLGQNSRPEVVDYLAEALSDGLVKCKRSKA